MVASFSVSSRCACSETYLMSQLGFSISRAGLASTTTVMPASLPACWHASGIVLVKPTLDMPIISLHRIRGRCIGYEDPAKEAGYAHPPVPEPPGHRPGRERPR